MPTLSSDLDAVATFKPNVAGEIPELFWTTSIHIEEIKEAYGVGTRQEVIKLAGSATCVEYRCGCGEPIVVRTRTEKLNTLRLLRNTLNQSRGPKWEARNCPKCRADLRAQEELEREAAKMAREAEVDELRSMPYRLYLKTDWWQRTRKRALRRAGWRCQLCSRKRTLHVHHNSYERRGNEHDEDLIVLCDECHESFHDHRELSS